MSLDRDVYLMSLLKLASIKTAAEDKETPTQRYSREMNARHPDMATNVEVLRRKNGLPESEISKAVYKPYANEPTVKSTPGPHSTYSDKPASEPAKSAPAKPAPKAEAPKAPVPKKVHAPSKPTSSKPSPKKSPSNIGPSGKPVAGLGVGKSTGNKPFDGARVDGSTRDSTPGVLDFLSNAKSQAKGIYRNGADALDSILNKGPDQIRDMASAGIDSLSGLLGRLPRFSGENFVQGAPTQTTTPQVTDMAQVQAPEGRKPYLSSLFDALGGLRDELGFQISPLIPQSMLDYSANDEMAKFDTARPASFEEMAAEAGRRAAGKDGSPSDRASKFMEGKARAFANYYQRAKTDSDKAKLLELFNSSVSNLRNANLDPVTVRSILDRLSGAVDSNINKPMQTVVSPLADIEQFGKSTYDDYRSVFPEEIPEQVPTGPSSWWNKFFG